jgi:hypothetical protein
MLRCSYLYAPRFIALVFVVHAFSPSSTSADPRGSKQQESDARELYRQGLAHYNLAEFDEAIQSFKTAYALSTEPELLFNIGQAYRFRRPPDCEQSLWHFRAYIRAKPDSPQRAMAERIIGELEACVAAEKQRHSDPAPELPAVHEAAPPAPAVNAAPTRTSPKHATSTAPLWAIATSALVVGSGAGLLLWSRAEYDALSTRCAPACTHDEVQAGARGQMVGVGLSAVGGVALAGAIAWWLVERRHNDSEDVGVVVSPIGVAASGRF